MKGSDLLHGVAGLGGRGGSGTKMGCFSSVQNLVFHCSLYVYVHSCIYVVQVIRYTTGEGGAMLLCSFKWIRKHAFCFPKVS